jgi:hypothetical protein
MKNLFLLFWFLAFSVSAFAQPAIADTTKVKLFDGANQWSSTMLAVKTYVGSGGGGGAPTNAQYLTLATDPTLTDERVLTPGTNVKAVDAGAGASLTLSVGTEKFILNGVISPASFSTNQDDYNPAGLATSSTIILEPTAAVNFTGLQGGEDGRIIILQNFGDFTLSIISESVSSTAANRFTLEAPILYLIKNAGVILKYDAIKSRWMVIGKSTHSQKSVTYEYTTPQTNTDVNILPGTQMVEVLCIGAGGGGGSGRKGAVGTVRCGGGGGGAGGVSHQTFSITELGTPAKLRIDVAAGGNGGAAQATNSTNGNPGTGAGATLVQTTGNVDIITAAGGNAGGGGTASAGTAGTAGGQTMFTAGAGAAASATGAVGASAAGINNCCPSGGGAGGGITSANASNGGGGGGACYYSQNAGGTAGTAGGGNGGAGNINTVGRWSGSGGGGGGASLAGNGGQGGAAARGGGGGGGGAAVNDIGNSGAGGKGGDGYCRITLYF